MKLSLICENRNPYDGITFLGEPQDDNDQLVAYRMRLVHTGNKATNLWMVYHKGIHFANIEKRDSRWVHDNWVKKYISTDIFKKADRTFLDSKLNDLINLIRRAISEKTAETVVLPVKQEQPIENDNIHTWTDVSGSLNLKAEYVGLIGDKVKFRRKDGRELDIPFKMLSPQSQSEINRINAKP